MVVAQRVMWKQKLQHTEVAKRFLELQHWVCLKNTYKSVGENKAMETFPFVGRNSRLKLWVPDGLSGLF